MAMFDSWRRQFIEGAGYAFRIEDLRERAIRCDSPLTFNNQVGITFVKEPMIQRTLFELMSSMGWSKSSLELERPYNPDTPGNGPRADFAIKNPESRRGRTWHYIEMKKYDTVAIKGDLKKLGKEGSKRSNRNHMLIYRTTTKSPSQEGDTVLLSMIKKQFPDSFHYTGKYPPVQHDFKTLVPSRTSNPYSPATPGRCEIVLVTLRNS